VVVQQYLEEIESIGDLRVLTVNGTIVGSVLRKPRPQNRLANLHQGGTAHPWELTPAQHEAAIEVSRALLKDGLFFVGLDFIGDYLTEINFISPSALRQINAVMKIRGEGMIIDEFERIWLGSVKKSCCSPS
jgi:glutathione synthase